MEIDYSAVPQQIGVKPTPWKPPRHVYFGRKDPETGQMEDEPVYTHQEFPRMLYKRDGDRVSAIEVRTEQDKAARLADGYVLTPREAGHLNAPSFEEHLAIKKAEQEKAAQVAAPQTSTITLQKKAA